MMRYSRYLIKTFILLLVFHFIIVQKAYAYLDPGTGSLIIQLVVASFIGVIFALKSYWKKIKYFFSHLFSTKQKGNKNGD